MGVGGGKVRGEAGRKHKEGGKEQNKRRFGSGKIRQGRGRGRRKQEGRKAKERGGKRWMSQMIRAPRNTIRNKRDGGNGMIEEREVKRDKEYEEDDGRGR